MRKAARQRAADFLPSAVLPRWAPVLEAATARAQERAGDPEPSLEEVRELERVAGLHRFADAALEATATDVSWDDHGVATITVACTVIGAGGRTGRPEVDVALVHRPTGARSSPPVVELTSSDDPPTTVLRVIVDPSTVDQPADHVLLLRARLGEIDVLDTIRTPEEAPAWLPLPVVSPNRSVLLPDRRGGIRLVTATPHAAGVAEPTSDGVTLDVSALRDGAEVATVEAKGLDDSESLVAEVRADGRLHLTIPEAGRWKVRARIDERWRDVAWR
jgi:hypothetical protein